MRRLAYGSTVLAGLLVSTVTGHPSPSMHGSNAQALRLSATEQVVWEKEEAYWQFVRGENRQEYLNLWDDRFVGWPASRTSRFIKTTLLGLCRNVRYWTTDWSLCLSENSAEMLLSPCIAQPFTVEIAQARMKAPAPLVSLIHG
jgi:hypothetical protein